MVVAPGTQRNVLASHRLLATDLGTALDISIGVRLGEGGISVDEKRLVVRGPFVVQPTVPYFAAPGDEVELSTLVANVLEGSGKGAAVEVGVALPRGFEAVGAAQQTLAIDEGRDEVARFRVKVSGEPGPVEVRDLGADLRQVAHSAHRRDRAVRVQEDIRTLDEADVAERAAP